MTRILFLLLTAISSLLLSCKKFLEIPFPQGQISSGAVFSDDSTAQAAMSGLYGQLMSSASIFMNGSLSIYPGLSADELFNTSPNATSDQFYSNSLLPTENSQVYNGLWRLPYTAIFHCNSILAGLSDAEKLSPVLKKHLTGEALVMRALCYFYLINLYGDVPLLLTTDYNENAVAARTAFDNIYERIKADLNEAIRLLSANYPNQQRTRINVFAAMAFLSRVYLYESNYQLAEETASSIINQSSVFSLTADLNKVFVLGSKETIFELYPSATQQNTGDGFAFIPATASSLPAFALTPGLMSSFESGDKRRISWVNSRTVNGETFYYPYKYKVRNGAISEANIVFRLAEQFLIRAEARAHLNDIPGSLADLNIVRQRAGLPSLDLSSSEEIITAIFQERRLELMAEKGHRWLDLKRTGKLGLTLGPLKPGWQDTDALFPIPQTEIDKNPFLKQNIGY